MTDVRRFMSCVAIINTSISSVERKKSGRGQDAERCAQSKSRPVLDKTAFLLHQVKKHLGLNVSW